MPTALTHVRKYYPNVEKVVDAKRGTKITVRAKDCEDGVGKAPNMCAIAKAAMRHFDGAIISLSSAYLILGKTAYRYRVPGHVTRELISFDKAHVFEPGVYVLDKVYADKQLGARKPTGKGVHNRTGEAGKRKRHYTQGVRALNSHHKVLK